MSDTKRTILAFVISFLILMGWYAFFTPTPSQPAPKAEPAAKTAAAQQPAPAATGEAKAAAPTLAPSPATVVAEERALLANGVVELALTNRGAKVEQVKLLKYNDKSGPSGKPLSLFISDSEGAGLTKLGDGGLKPNALYTVAAKTPGSITYAYRTTEGIRVEKTYTLASGRYDADLKIRVVNEGREPVKDRLTVYQLGDFRKEASRYEFHGPAYVKDESFHEVDAKDAAKGELHSGNVSWAGTAQNYFLAALIPKDFAATDLSLATEGDEKGIVRIALLAPTFDLPVGGEATFDYRFFAGPKLADVIVPVGANLEKALYYGWFTIIAKPLSMLLNTLYGIVGNYGIAIIFLTLLIKLLFWPLSAKSFKSMARMKELQPKVDRLKERYGDDKEKLNMEMMQLWKTHKVNPFSGCLPILVQIPVFIALYRLLMSSIEIRHAPFYFWLTDLSAPDPYYITPLLMGGSMFLQQKMTPATGMGEGQMKFMLYGMPILFTWLFKDFASGLVIYWLMNNVFSIAQQALMLRTGNKNPKTA